MLCKSIPTTHLHTNNISKIIHSILLGSGARLGGLGGVTFRILSIPNAISRKFSFFYEAPFLYSAYPGIPVHLQYSTNAYEHNRIHTLDTNDKGRIPCIPIIPVILYILLNGKISSTPPPPSPQIHKNHII